MLALRIGTVKKLEEFFRIDGPARVMIVGVAKESTETTASSESDIGVRAVTLRIIWHKFLRAIWHTANVSIDAKPGSKSEAKKIGVQRDGGRADYALFDRRSPALAVLETKSTNVSLSAGEAQGSTMSASGDEADIRVRDQMSRIDVQPTSRVARANVAKARKRSPAYS